MRNTVQGLHEQARKDDETEATIHIAAISNGNSPLDTNTIHWWLHQHNWLH